MRSNSKKSRRQFSVLSPYDKSVVGECPDANLHDLEIAVARSADGRRLLDGMTTGERAAVLRCAADLIAERRDGLATLITIESGKTIRQAASEVSRAVETLGIAAGECERIHGETVPLDLGSQKGSRFGFYLRVPVGTVAGITPFSTPLNSACHKAASALAAGNVVILKPSPLAPLSTVELAKILVQAGAPADSVCVLTTTSNKVTEAIFDDERIRLVSFTGSARIGKELARRASLKKLILELGSNAACVVCQSADLDQAASAIVTGAFAQSGQRCVSVQRVYAHRKVYTNLLDLLLARTAQLKIGNPMDRDVDLGPMIREESAKRAESWIREAKAGGAKVRIGGKRHGSFLEATILTNVTSEMKVVKEEAFAPLFSITPFSKIEDALNMANDSRYGLNAGVFTAEISEASKAIESLQVGTVMINDAPTYRVENMPFGGWKDSGVGIEGIKFEIDAMLDYKFVCFNGFWGR